MQSLKILGISGSLRQGSLNTKLMRAAIGAFAPQSSLEADLNLPLYDGDVEKNSGIPAVVQTLADQIASADAVVIATPEYNQNLSGVLKNALDWVSRVDGNPWLGKPVAIMSAAAGRTGGARAQYSLRHCMTPFRPMILQGPEVMLASASSAFDEAGEITDERYLKALSALMDELRRVALNVSR